MKKDSFEKKLAAYVATAAAYLATHPVDANAQVMYTDVNPDLVISNGFFNLDLNNDGVVDFKLENSQFKSSDGGPCSFPCDAGGQSFYDAIAYPFGNNQFLQLNSSSGSFIRLMNAGDTIGMTGQFGTGNDGSGNNGSYLNHFSSGWYYFCGGGTDYQSWAMGPMFPGQEKYIGFKVSNGGNYYGWARIELGNNDEIILKDYAINTIADSSIVTGDTGVVCSINNINTSPSGNYWMCGDSVTVELSDASSLSIQWMKNGDWLTGENDTVYTAFSKGNYSALVSDGVCSQLVNATTLDTIHFTIDQACIGDSYCELNGGSIWLVVEGNSPGYTYSWNNAPPTSLINNLSPGLYSVTVHSNVCPASDSVTADFMVNGSPPVTVSLAFPNFVCDNSGSVDLTVNSGTAPYTYEWNNGQTTEDLQNISSGTYNVTVHDSSGCSTTASAHINYSNITFSNSHINTCDSAGVITLSNIQGHPSYDFIWSNGDTTQNISGLSAGVYTVTVHDAMNCTAQSSVQIYQLNVWVSEVHGDACMDEGYIHLSATGGIPGYSYLWSNGSSFSSIENLTSGTYQVTVNDTRDCVDTLSIEIVQLPIPQPVITQVGNDLTTGTYVTYQWYMSSIPISGAYNQIYTPTQSNFYKVGVTNSDGCFGMSDVILVLVNGTTDLQVNESLILIEEKQLSILNSSLIGGQIDFFNALGQQVRTITISASLQTEDLSALPAGIYFYHIRSKQKTYSGKFIIE